MPIPQVLYYAFFAFLSCYVLIRSTNYDVNVFLLLFISIAIFSVFGNEIPSKFAPLQRLMIFIIVTLPISSVISSKFIIRFRIELYKIFLKVIAIIIVISFIGYLTNLGIFYHQKTGTFRGLMIYCMVLGPYAGIASIYLIIKYVSTKKKLYVAAAIAAVLVCLLSGSRGAIVSFICAAVYLLAIICKNNIRLLLKVYVSLFIVLMAASPILLPYTEAVRQKQENNMKLGGTFSSRDKLFDDRITEFIASPIIGSGFASVNENVAHNTSINKDTGTIEPGSSWLFVLSSMGIIAFAIFSFLIIKPIIKLYLVSSPKSYSNMMIGSALLLFAVHMVVEGYVLAAGSFMFWGAWLCIGIAQNDTLEYIKNENYSIL